MTDDRPASPSILVVEDDEHICELLSFLLTRQGYRVDTCADGRAARSLIEAASDVPQMILLDVMLPYIDGFELVGIIRARTGWGAVPIVMLTAKTTESDIVRALDAGANDYIVKPFQPNELMARVRRYLRQA
jgi:two-component system, OmpR family, alkaline phosphatase synthesis response regulator PhoP